MPPKQIDKLFKARDMSTRHQGKTDYAPCGHPGEHIFMNYIQCTKGCDAVPEHIPRETTQKYCSSHGSETKLIYTPWGVIKKCSFCGDEV